MDRFDALKYLMEGLKGISGGDTERTPIPLDDILRESKYYDGRDFNPGDIIMKRRDGKDVGEGGQNNYSLPFRGEPAIVLGHCLDTETSARYENNTLVIFCQYKDQRLLRVSVDPAHFELYEAPGSAEIY